MMCRSCSFLFLFLFCFNFKGSAQDNVVIDKVRLICEYNYRFQQDSVMTNSVTNELMILQVGHKYSRFTGQNVPDKDSILEANKDADVQYTIDKLMPLIRSQPGNVLAKFSIYKSYSKKGRVEMLSELSRDAHYRVVHSNALIWRIEPNRVKHILGYRCQQATTCYAGRRYVAWFTRSIPVSDGPYKFQGLPGLILRVEDTRKQHCFELINIQKTNYIKPLYFSKSKYVTVTPKDYVNAVFKEIKVRNAMIARMSGITEEKRAEALYKMQIKNNFIERY